MKKKTTVPKVTNDIQKEEKFMISNGLTEAIFGNSAMPGSSQLSQVDTLFKNSRWYLISNMRQILSEIYVEHGIIQTITDVPVDDAFRGGVIIKSEELSEEDIKKLQNTMEREDDMGTVAQANKWKRLFGGSAILIITDQDPSKELDLSKIKEDSPLEFRAVDLWELYSEMNVGDYTNAQYAKVNEKHFNYYGQRIHHSRVMKMKGLKAPSFIRPRLRGWGFSVVESLVRSVNQYLKATDLSFEVLDEHKLDIFKIKGLTQALAAKDGAAKINQRVTMANQQKSYMNALTMDAEDDYQQKELAFGGLSEVMAGIRMQMASDLRMPLTKVFGISAAGFSSGEDDIENYNGMIESTVRTSSKFDIVRLVEIRCQKLFGFVPEDLTIDFHPLRVLSSEQEENVKTQKFSRIQMARSMGEMDSKEFKEACNKHDLLGVVLDTTRDTLPPLKGPDDLDSGEGGGAPAGKLSAPEAAPVKNSDGNLPHIVVVGIINGDRILTGRRRDNGLWTFPGGHLDAGENPERGACREVLEEVGITITPAQLKKVSHEKVVSHRTGKEFFVTAYTATVPKSYLKETNRNDPDQEFEILKWVKLDEKTEELLPGNRHAKKDAVLDHLFNRKNNSLGYEVALYREAMGADSIGRWRKRQYDGNDAKDQELWKQCVADSVRAYGKEDWKFIIWHYENQGGSFK